MNRKKNDFKNLMEFNTKNKKQEIEFNLNYLKIFEHLINKAFSTDFDRDIYLSVLANIFKNPWTTLKRDPRALIFIKTHISNRIFDLSQTNSDERFK